MKQKIEEIDKKLDKLQGSLSIEEYIPNILGIISLKYFSDKFKMIQREMEKYGDTWDDYDKEPKKFYITYETFIVPEKSSWNYIMDFANDKEIGAKLDNSFLELEENNPDLIGLFNKNYNNQDFNQTNLGNIVKIFSDFDFTQKNSQNLINSIYEYFLDKLFKERIKNGRDFYTPKSIISLMINILQPIKGTIYDPACGTGGILVQTKRFIEEHEGNPDGIFVYGQEKVSTNWKLAKLNLVLNGFLLEDTRNHLSLGERATDSFIGDQHKNMNFDFAMVHPPFNDNDWGQNELLDDSRWQWGIPPANDANGAWLSLIVSKLNENGRAAVVLPRGSLSYSQEKKLKIPTNMVKENKVDAIIELPDRLFYTSPISAAIWLFNNNKKTNNILMISSKAVQGKLYDKNIRELTQENIDYVVNLFNHHEKGEEVQETGIAKTITAKDLEDNDYSFVPGRYVGSIEEHIDKEEIKKAIQDLSVELDNLLTEFDQLVPNVKRAIAQAIDYKEGEE